MEGAHGRVKHTRTGTKTPGGAGTHTGHTGHTGARGQTDHTDEPDTGKMSGTVVFFYRTGTGRQ